MKQEEKQEISAPHCYIAVLCTNPLHSCYLKGFDKVICYVLLLKCFFYSKPFHSLKQYSSPMLVIHNGGDFIVLDTVVFSYAGFFISWGLKSSRMYHPKICHFGIRTAFRLRQLRRSRYKEGFLLSSYLPKSRT